MEKNISDALKETLHLNETIRAYDDLFEETMQEFTKAALCNKEVKGTDLYNIVKKAEEKMSELRIKYLYTRRGWDTVNERGKNE